MKVKFLSILLFIALISGLKLYGLSKEIEEALAQPEKIAENFPALKKGALIDRVTATPPFIINYLTNMDEINYQDYTLNLSERELLSKILNELPKSYQKIISERVVGIYFLKDLWGSGLTDFAVDKNGKVFTYMVFNPKLLSMNLEEWLNWKEVTCFQNDNSPYSIKIKASKNLPAILGILLHETSHAVDYVERKTPFVEKFWEDYYREQNQALTSTLFTSGVWASYRQPEKQFDYPKRKDVTFYGFNKGPKIPMSQAKETYDGLDQTPFASLYGSIIWPEDYAETALVYYLTQKYHVQYSLSVISNGSEISFYQPATKPLFLKRAFENFTNSD